MPPPAHSPVKAPHPLLRGLGADSLSPHPEVAGPKKFSASSCPKLVQQRERGGSGVQKLCPIGHVSTLTPKSISSHWGGSKRVQKQLPPTAGNALNKDLPPLFAEGKS